MSHATSPAMSPASDCGAAERRLYRARIDELEEELRQLRAAHGAQGAFAETGHKVDALLLRRHLRIFPATTAVLAMLMRRAPNYIDAETFVGTAVGDTPHAIKCVHIHIHHIRRALRHYRIDAEIQCMRGAGYALDYGSRKAIEDFIAAAQAKAAGEAEPRQ